MINGVKYTAPHICDAEGKPDTAPNCAEFLQIDLLDVSS